MTARRLASSRLAALCLSLAAACDAPSHDAAAPETPSAATHRVVIEAEVPAGAPAVYLAGSLDALGPWAPDGLRMDGDGTVRTAAIALPAGTVFEYKFTLGAWEREALGPSGMILGNHRLIADAPKTVRHVIGDFRKPVLDYVQDPDGAGVEGRLLYWEDVPSAHLSQVRRVGIWLPPGYDDDETRRYPVIYMSDGQNLFDPRIANTGVDWGVDEAMMAGVREGAFPPAIVVAVWSTSRRALEYSPWHEAPSYARFLKEELKPRIDRTFRTLTGPDDTFHMGSSMGGLLSFYLVRDHADVFSACGCLSTHTPLSEAMIATFSGADPTGADPAPYILRDIADGAVMPEGQRLFLDYGTENLDSAYGPGHEALRAWLLKQGFEEGPDFLIRDYPGADHNEASWRARAQDQIAWLLASRTR